MSLIHSVKLSMLVSVFVCVVLSPAIGRRGSITFAWLNFCPIEQPPFSLRSALVPCLPCTPLRSYLFLCVGAMLTAAGRACQLFGPSQRKTKLNETKLPNYRRLASSKAWELPLRTRHVVKCISSASQQGRGAEGCRVATLTHIGAGRQAGSCSTN